MVWRENGKYGSCTGRTLRRGDLRSKPLLKDRGFLVKTVIKEDVNFTDAEIRNVLEKFRLQDGLNDDDVVKESRENRFEHFGNRRGHFGLNMSYSLGKRKRWLIPEILKDEIPNRNDNEMDYNVVLVERVSSTCNNCWECSRRLKHGDCYSVCEGDKIRKPRRRKFAHVGDLRRSSSNKSEIVYEVNHTERAPSWPTYLQCDWREWRDHRKARDKEKGKKNKRRSWGCYSRREIQRTACENLHRGSLFRGTREKSNVHQNYSNLMSCDEDNSSSMAFDLGKYISEVLVTSSANKAKKPRVNEQVFSGLNPASSELVKFYGKGSTVYMDSVDCGCHDSTKPIDHSEPTLDVPVTSYWADKEEIVSVGVAVKRERLDAQTLRDHFGEKHKESLSLPRRFSISAKDLATQFVFTCSSVNLTSGCNEEVVETNLTVVGDALPSEKWQAVKEFLNSTFERFSLGYKQDKQAATCSTRPVCGKGICHQVPSRKGVMPFNLLYKMNQWESRAVSRDTALAELMPVNDPYYNQHVADEENSSTDQRIPDTVWCGICCNEIRQGNFKGSNCCCTAMRSCLHWFCDDCWKGYLTAQLQQGNTSIKCPEYGCVTLVDDVTVMGLLPCKFSKYREMKRERELELSSAWQWCPGDKCNLVVMVTTSGSRSEKRKDAIEANKEMEAVPVSCPCGHSWCFACQERPHWPASCREAAFFQGQTKTYETLVRAKVGDITSVRVKRCPICNYPIEKNQGCPHMNCTMCKGEFCWTCLARWAGHDWDACSHKTKEEEEVELVNVMGSSRFNTHMRVAIANYHARAGCVLFERYSALEKLTNALLSQDQIVNVDGNRHSCAPRSLFNKYKSSNIPSYLKAALDFKFQAHFVLEGASMLMAVSKSRYYHDKLKAQLSLLMFVIDRLEDRATNKQLWSAAEKAHFQILLEAGRHCLYCIKHICIKIHQKQTSTL